MNTIFFFYGKFNVQFFYKLNNRTINIERMPLAPNNSIKNPRTLKVKKKLKKKIKNRTTTATTTMIKEI